MQKKYKVTCIFSLCACISAFSACTVHNQKLNSGSSVTSVKTADINLSVNKQDGTYIIKTKNPQWTFAGKIAKPLNDLKILQSSDGIGNYKAVFFFWQDNCKKSGQIRIYEKKPVVIFSVTNLEAAEKTGRPFPELTTFPAGLYTLSYKPSAFAESTYSLMENGTPWIFFDDKADTFIISPASNFMVSSMLGNYQTKIASGFNSELSNLPKDYSHQTILVAAEGINNSFEIWGHALTDLYGKKRPANDADVTLKYVGYWTDNGAEYYYKYDLDKGYEGTLLAVKDYYDRNRIPIKYMQLDSWFYPKTTANAAGVFAETGTTTPPPNPTAPKWDNRGGIFIYDADKTIFPDGLKGFQKKLNLPLVVHARWFDRKSPYHNKYKISGVGPIDPTYWNDTIARIVSDGVAVYEQDWLNEIYFNSPQFPSTVYAADAFMDNMAKACKDNNITMQYCMAMPRHFLQGAKYSNLTTIRTCWDRFSWNRWSVFLYATRLASAVGIWPWADVCRSTEKNNLLMYSLSAGAVGFSDAIGNENKNNIMHCVRNDGVIIKPDQPVTPIDATYISDAQGMGKPVICTTFTNHQNGKTFYLFAYSRNIGAQFFPESDTIKFHFSPKQVGAAGDYYIYNYFTQNSQKINADESFEGFLAKNNEYCAYYIIAPVGKSKIALLGDKDKFVTCGKNRIKELVDSNQKLTAQVIFAKGEDKISLLGFAPKKVKIKASNCKLDNLKYDNKTQQFTLSIAAAENTKWISDGPDMIAQTILTLELE